MGPPRMARPRLRASARPPRSAVRVPDIPGKGGRQAEIGKESRVVRQNFLGVLKEEVPEAQIPRPIEDLTELRGADVSVQGGFSREGPDRYILAHEAQG